jgi:hypothetical protein
VEGVVRTFPVQSYLILTDTNAEFLDNQFELDALFLFVPLVVVPLLGNFYLLTYVCITMKLQESKSIRCIHSLTSQKYGLHNEQQPRERPRYFQNQYG